MRFTAWDRALRNPLLRLTARRFRAPYWSLSFLDTRQAHFTGAEKRKHGLMEVADGASSSWMRYLQCRWICKPSFYAPSMNAPSAGWGINMIKVDVQILAASNRDLFAMMKEERFREDLYFRLKSSICICPHCRERKEDIPVLVDGISQKNNQRMG